MAVWVFNGRPVSAVMLAIIILIMLSACGQATDESTENALTASKEVAATAPGIITGDEALPAGHPPIEGLQNPVEPPVPTAEALPAGHPSMPGVEGNVDMGVRPTDEPEHPPSSGKELNVAIPESVQGKWSSVQLEAILPDGSKKEIHAILGEETDVSGEGLMIRAEIFLPAYISDFETIKSVSNELTNPAVKVRLLKDREIAAVGWVFQKYPEFNSFRSDLVELKLVSAEAAENH